MAYSSPSNRFRHPQILWRSRMPHQHAPVGKPLPPFAVTGAGAPLPDDFTREYTFELAARERLGLPELSPSEFRQIRNWRDGIEEDEG